MQSRAVRFLMTVEIDSEGCAVENNIVSRLSNNRSQLLAERRVHVTVPTPETLLRTSLDLHDNILRCTVNNQNKVNTG